MHWMLLKPPSALHLCLLFQDALGKEGIITQLKMSFAFFLLFHAAHFFLSDE